MVRTARRFGFSLVELSIVLAILGVVTAGGLTIGASVVEQQANIASNTQLDEIDKAIKDYYQVNGFLPCPARSTVALGGGATFGVATDCSAAVVAGVTDAGTVRVGALPVRTLGLRDRMIADEFGNRYIYAVTETQAVDAPGFEANNGAIRVNDNSGAAISTTVSYIVLSTGNDGKGSVRYQTGGTLPNACTAATGLDVENCDNNGTFRDARFNNGSVVASYFDDFVRWTPKFRLNALESGTGDSLWEASGDDIYAVGTDADSATGNVGINTMSPDSQFTVQGTGSNGSGGRSNITMLTTAASGQATLGAEALTDNYANLNLGSEVAGVRRFWHISKRRVANNHDLNFYFYDGGSFLGPYLNLGADGDIGINTGAPTTKLTIEDASAGVNSTFQGGTPFIRLNGNVATWSEPAIDFGELALNPIARISAKNTGNGAGDLIFSTRLHPAATPTEKMRIQDDGKVGIGTIAPQQLLELSKGMALSGPYDFPLALRINSAPGAFQSTGIAFVNAVNGTAPSASNTIGSIQFGTASTGPLCSNMSMSTNRSNALNTAFNMNCYGNVSLGSIVAGTTARLVVEGTAIFDGHIFGSTPTTRTNIYGSFISGQSGGSNGQLNLNYTGGAGAGVTVGGVAMFGGVGTNLAVYGTTTNCTLGNGAGGTSCSSDIRLKKNVKTIDSALDKIDKLRGVTFEWKSEEKEKGRHLGLIAQEVEPVFPDAVHTEEKTKMKSLDYASLVSPIINAVKELHAMVKDIFERLTTIDARLDALEKENAELKARLDKLEAKAAK